MGVKGFGRCGGRYLTDTFYEQLGYTEFTSLALWLITTMDGWEALIMEDAGEIKLFTAQGGNSVQRYTSTWDRLRQYRRSEEYIC